MEAHGSFDGTYSWKLQLIEAMEASGSTDNGSFHIFPRKDISTDFHGRFHGCTSMEANLLQQKLPWKLVENPMKVSGKSHGSWWKFKFPWKLVEI